MIKSPLEGEGSETSQVEQSTRDLAEVDEGSKAEFAHLLAHLDREAPDLALVVRTWTDLASPLRAAVLAIVRSSAAPEGTRER